MDTRQKFHVESGMFNALCLTHNKREAAIESVQFMTPEQFCEDYIYVWPLGERRTASNTEMFNTQEIVDLANFLSEEMKKEQNG